jgi:membrane fusion protein (multidrug efflux system)
VHVGEFIATNAPDVEIVVDDPLRLTVTVPERFSSSLRIGLPVALEVDSRPGERFPAFVSRIAADVDPRTRTIAAEATVPNPERRLKPGQFARAALDLGARAAVLVPRAALLTFSGTNRVFVVGEDGIVESRVVITGRDLGEEVVIVEGVSAGERLATSHLERLGSGVRVAVSLEARS